MRALNGSLATWLLASSLAGGLAAQEISQDRLYGRVVTASGDVLEGYIRWDRNEASWADLLNGSKRMPPEWADEVAALRRGGEAPRGAADRRGLELFGLRISWDDDDDYPRTAESGIRFGHIRSLAVLGRDAALLTLKSGEEVELEGGSTDLGDEVRGVVVEDPAGGTVELRWHDVDVVEFVPAPPGSASRASRLHGTLTDRWGNRYTGYVSWDLDEVFTTDVLDGDERGRDREIPFGRIAAIERAGSCCARVTLSTGEELELDGSNDVDDDNRGIQISDPLLGQVQVDWDAFASLRFHPPERPTGYEAFDGGRRLRGQVVTEGGERHEGRIRWDNDESWTWEILDGRYRGVVYDVELGNVRHIEKRSSRGVVVTLHDGRVLELEGSNDVARGNKGIVIEADDGRRVLVEWEEFREVLLER